MATKIIEVGKIYAAISAVMRDVDPIAKDRQNVEQRFKFRGIDDIYNNLNPVMAKHGVFFASEIVSETRTERKGKSGGMLFCVVLRVRYKVFATDGSFITVETIGESFDPGDKAASKAMSVAYKYALMQLFCIPTEDEKDPDQHSHDVVKPPVAEPKPLPPNQPDQPPANPELASDSQRKLLFAAAARAGWDKVEIKAFLLKNWGYTSSQEITAAKFSAVLRAVETGGVDEVPPDIGGEHDNNF